jgi:hypothetical protein
MVTFPTRFAAAFHASWKRVQEIVARAQEAADEGVCHIELASEEPWFRSMGCIVYNYIIYIYITRYISIIIYI